MKPNQRIEHEVLDRLGLLPDSDPPNDEPNYEARLRKLGTALAAKGADGADCLAALALHHSGEPTVEALGLARIYATAMGNLAPMLTEASRIGAAILKERSEG